MKIKLNEGLRKGDLKYFLSDIFSIDRFKSKMGDDKNVIVLSFKLKEKMSSMDLEEFIEGGYSFVLDADSSAGEDKDGGYIVFVEIERNKKAAKNIENLIQGIGKLADIDTWKFRYYKDHFSQEFTIENFEKSVPLTADDYQQHLEKEKEKDIKEFFNQGATEVLLETDNKLIFKKPYSGNLEFKLISIGDYDAVKSTLFGRINISERAQSEIIFLNKYLGQYEIDKIDDLFLIKNKDQAVVLSKNNW